jgi:hypothetical protein
MTRILFSLAKTVYVSLPAVEVHPCEQRLHVFRLAALAQDDQLNQGDTSHLVQSVIAANR